MIYFIQDTATGAIKIGVSRKPAKRMSDLQVAHAKPLILLAVMDGGVDEERHIHRLFNRLAGEWFKPEPDLFAFIEKHATRITQHIESSPSNHPPDFRHRSHIREPKMNTEQIRSFVDFLSRSGLD